MDHFTFTYFQQPPPALEIPSEFPQPQPSSLIQQQQQNQSAFIQINHPQPSSQQHLFLLPATIDETYLNQNGTYNPSQQQLQTTPSFFPFSRPPFHMIYSNNTQHKMKKNDELDGSCYASRGDQMIQMGFPSSNLEENNQYPPQVDHVLSSNNIQNEALPFSSNSNLQAFNQFDEYLKAKSLPTSACGLPYITRENNEIALHSQPMPIQYQNQYSLDNEYSQFQANIHNFQNYNNVYAAPLFLHPSQNQPHQLNLNQECCSSFFLEPEMNLPQINANYYQQVSINNIFQLENEDQAIKNEIPTKQQQFQTNCWNLNNNLVDFHSCNKISIAQPTDCQQSQNVDKKSTEKIQKLKEDKDHLHLQEFSPLQEMESMPISKIIFRDSFDSTNCSKNQYQQSSFSSSDQTASKPDLAIPQKIQEKKIETIKSIMKQLPPAYLPFFHRKQSDLSKLEYLKKYHPMPHSQELKKLSQLLPSDLNTCFQNVDLEQLYENQFIMTGVLSNIPDESKIKIGTLTRKQRRDKILKYKQKRGNRECKKVSYDVRKRVADSRLRVKGRFVTKEQVFKIIGNPEMDFDKFTTSELKELLIMQRYGSDEFQRKFLKNQQGEQNEEM